MENFIFESYLNDLSICDRLVDYHSSSVCTPGVTFGSVNPEIKDSMDCYLDDVLLANSYITELQSVVNQYIEKFPMCNFYAPWSITESINIQHYKPGQGFKAWHTERGSADPRIGRRHLVFMTYLNDVSDGGTEFIHQNIITTARKGKTVIWPVDWTYTHRGQISLTEEKYIATGWFSFV